MSSIKSSYVIKYLESINNIPSHHMNYFILSFFSSLFILSLLPLQIILLQVLASYRIKSRNVSFNNVKSILKEYYVFISLLGQDYLKDNQPFQPFSIHQSKPLIKYYDIQQHSHDGSPVDQRFLCAPSYVR